MDLEERARIHAALGDPHRLEIVDRLILSDRTFNELATGIALPGNAAAHHLAVLEMVGLIERRTSEGDHRRRYITLRPERLEGLIAAPTIGPGMVLFVCTHNSARSQFAAALWTERTGRQAESAGTTPATAIHPGAILEAHRYGVDLGSETPRGYDALTMPPDLVVSVCDRAREAGLPFDAPSIHWSVPDPVAAASPESFRSSFADVASRVDRLAAAAAA